MDVPPVAGRAPQPPVAHPPAGLESDTSRRLATLESGLAELGERLERLAASLEGSLRAAVTEEVRTASAELRHTVSELGRLLVRDLGRLSKILAEHRDSIVADLRPVEPGGMPAPPGEDVPSEAPAPSGEGDASGTPADATDPVAGSADGERQRRTLLRRRQA